VPSLFRRNTHVLSLALLTLVVIAIGVFSTIDWDEYSENATVARHARSVAETTQKLMSGLEGAQGADMGYLLTGDANYLASVEATRSSILKNLDDLGRPSTGLNDAAAVARINTLVKDRLLDFQNTIDLRRSGDSDGARAYLVNHQSLRKLGDVRAVLEKVKDEEYNLYNVRSQIARGHAANTRLVVLLGTVLLAVLLFVANIHIHKLVRAQDRFIEDLAAARDREQLAKAAFEITLESIGDAVISVDAGGRVQFLNSAAEKLTGWPRSSAMGGTLADVFPLIDESTGQALPNPAMRVMEGGNLELLPDTALLVTHDGRRVPIDDSAAPLRDPQGKSAGAVLVFRDVSPRREAQRQLEDSERRYRLLFDSNPHPMWVYEVGSLKFLEVNHSAVEHYGYSREEFLRMTLRDIRPPEDVPDLLRDTDKASSERHTDGPWRHRKKDGTIIYVEITAHPLLFQGCDARFVLSHDITDRAQLEHQLRQSQKLEAVGRLAGGVAHDFNNMLTVISGYADLLGASLAPGDSAAAPVAEIAAAAQRAASLTQQLLAFSRRQVLQPKVLNLNTSLVNIRKMLERLLGEDIEIRTVLAPDLWQVSADPGQIDQIVMNLAVNARDAMENGGTLTLQTTNVTLDDDYVSSHVGVDAGEYVCLSVIDTGHGMDEATKARLFEPFFTTKEVGRGTGLGLSTVYGIVKQSHGNIWVYSEPGKGTMFSVYLPRCRTPLSPVRTLRKVTAPQASGQSILVVEDDPDVLRLVSAMLISSGYAVLGAQSLEAALQACEKPDPIDLLLCDMVLPQNDGPTIAQHVTQVRPGLPVIFMSGYTEHAVLRSETVEQAPHFLQKPFSRETLTNKIRSLLGPKN
jgi:PAS domain S-box-containing protein